MINIPINFEGLERINSTIERINRRFRSLSRPIEQLNNSLRITVDQTSRMSTSISDFEVDMNSINNFREAIDSTISASERIEENLENFSRLIEEINRGVRDSIDQINRINRVSEDFSNTISQVDMSSTAEEMEDIRNLSESSSDAMREQVQITRRFERRASQASASVRNMASQIRNGVLQAEAMKFAFSAVGNVISSGVGFAIEQVTEKFRQFQSLVSEQFSKAQESSKAIRSQANSFVSILEKATGEEQDIKEVTKKIKRIRAQLAQAAAALPVSNENILQVFDAISDDLTSQVYDGNLKKLEKSLEDQGGLVGRVALAVEDSTASWADFNQDMNQFLAGDVQDVGWIADVASNRNKFEEVLKEFGIPSIKEFKKATEGDVKKKFEILQQWTDTLFTEEYIKSMGNTLKGAQEGIKSLIFDTESGLLGFNRDVEVIRKDYQGKSKSQIEKLIKTKDDITEEMVYESTTLFNEIEKLSVPIIKEFSNVISSIFNLSGTTSDISAPLMQGIFNLRKSLETNIFKPIGYIIEDFNNSPELQKNPAKFVGQMLGRIANKIIDSLSKIFSPIFSSSSFDIKSPINDFIEEFIGGIKEELGEKDINKLDKFLEESIGFLENIFKSLGDIINEVWGKISPYISPLISRAFNTLVGIVVGAIKLASPFIQPIIKGLLNILGTTLIEVLKSDIKIPLALIGTLFIGPVTSALLTSLASAVSGVFSSAWFIGLISNPVGWAVLAVLAVTALIKAFETPLSNLANSMQENGFFLVRWIGDYLEQLVKFWSGVFDLIWGIVTLNGDKIKTALKQIFDSILDTIRKLDPRTWFRGRNNTSPELDDNKQSRGKPNRNLLSNSQSSNLPNSRPPMDFSSQLEKISSSNEKIKNVIEDSNSINRNLGESFQERIKSLSEQKPASYGKVEKVIEQNSLVNQQLKEVISSSSTRNNTEVFRQSLEKLDNSQELMKIISLEKNTHTILNKENIILSKISNDLQRELSIMRNQNNRIISNIKQASLKNSGNFSMKSPDIESSSSLIVLELKELRSSVRNNHEVFRQSSEKLDNSQELMKIISLEKNTHTILNKENIILSKISNDLQRELSIIRNQNNRIISNIKQASLKNSGNFSMISGDFKSSSSLIVLELKGLRSSVSSDLAKMSSKLDNISVNPFGSGDGDKGIPKSGGGAITSIGKTLVNSGYNAWQHPDFNLNSGFTGSGKERVWMRPYNSYHNAGRALDFPISHNSPQALDKLYSELIPLRQQGIIKELIWRGPGHYDHLHMAANQGFLDPLKEELKKKPNNSKLITANTSETVLNRQQTKEVASSINSGGNTNNVNVNVNFYGYHSARESAEMVAQEIQKAIENSKYGRV